MFWRDPSPSILFPYRGYKIPVSLAFDNVLSMFEVFEHEKFTDEQKYDIAFEIFTDEEIWDDFPLHIRIDFVIQLLKNKLDIDLTKPSEDEKEPPPFDFIEDAGRIHSSFLFDYNMDLREQQGKMSWETFLSLMFNLSDDSQFGKAVYYRQCPIPKQDKYNADEIKRLKEQKEKYALKNERVIEKMRRIKEKEVLAKMEAHKRKVKGG